jgi:signal transduction histidine kinase
MLYHQGIMRDITERKRSEQRAQAAHAQLRVLTHGLNTVREEETAMLAREIHDELGQQLTGLKMDVSWIASKLDARQSALKARATEALAHIDASIETVRDIAARLRPAILDHLGLVAAIEWHAQTFQKKSGIDCEVISNKSAIRLKPDHAIALYRIVQEAMTNVVRHAGATRIDVGLYQKDARLALEIRDNGRGIEPDAHAGRKSIGLLGMRERARAAGARFAIEGFPGKGTVVTVQMPLQPHEAAERSGARPHSRPRFSKIAADIAA